MLYKARHYVFLWAMALKNRSRLDRLTNERGVDYTCCQWSSSDGWAEKYPVSCMSCSSRNILLLGRSVSMATRGCEVLLRSGASFSSRCHTRGDATTRTRKLKRNLKLIATEQRTTTPRFTRPSALRFGRPARHDKTNTNTNSIHWIRSGRTHARKRSSE